MLCGMASTHSPRWAPLPTGLGALLYNARRRAGLSREGLARAVGISSGQLQGLEEERRPPSVDVAERISAALRLGPWEDAVFLAVAVDTGQLRSRRGVRHMHRRGAPLPRSVRDRIACEREAGRSWRAIAAGLNQDGAPTMVRGSWWATSVCNVAAEGNPSRER